MGANMTDGLWLNWGPLPKHLWCLLRCLLLGPRGHSEGLVRARKYVCDLYSIRDYGGPKCLDIDLQPFR